MQENRDVDREINRKIESLFFPLVLYTQSMFQVYSLFVCGLYSSVPSDSLKLFCVCVFHLYRLSSAEFSIQSMTFIWVLFAKLAVMFLTLQHEVKNHHLIFDKRIDPNLMPSIHTHTHTHFCKVVSHTSRGLFVPPLCVCLRQENIPPNFCLNMKVIICLWKVIKSMVQGYENMPSINNTLYMQIENIIFIHVSIKL